MTRDTGITSPGALPRHLCTRCNQRLSPDNKGFHCPQCAQIRRSLQGLADVQPPEKPQEIEPKHHIRVRPSAAEALAGFIRELSAVPDGKTEV